MEERILVHKWRSEEHSILVGDNTVIADDPGLDVRYWTGINPHRLVLSERADLDTDLKIFSGDPPAIIFTTNKEADYQNAEVIHLPESAMAISMIIKEMIKREKQSILVEGGAKVLLQFIEKGLWDEARIFRGKKQFGSGLKAPAIDGRKISEQDFEHSRLEHWLPEQ